MKPRISILFITCLLFGVHMTAANARESRTSAGAQEPSVVMDDPMSGLQDVLRKPLAGEVRAQGVLTRIDCANKGLVFIIKIGDRLLKLHSAGFDNLHLMAYTTEGQGEITCGVRKTESAVVVTYRPSKKAKARLDGEMAAMEFVPASFVLKQ